MPPINYYLWLIIAFFFGDRLFKTYLSLRQYRRTHNRQLPAALVGIVNEHDFCTAQAYWADHHKHSMVTSLLSTTKSVLEMVFGLFVWLWALSRSLALEYVGYVDEPLQTVILAILTLTIVTVTDTPFFYYYNFVTMKRHNRNVLTRRQFFQDMAEGYALVLLISPPAVWGMIYLVRWGGDFFVLYVCGFVFAYQLAMATIYPVLIAPLFNKFTHLEEGPLKTKIEAMATAAGFPLGRIQVIDSSKRSLHSNAYFTGFWWNRRIVLYDTLLKTLNEDETVAVLAHELGHWKMGHLTVDMILGQLNNLVTYLMLYLIMGNQEVYATFGFYDEQPVIVGLAFIHSMMVPVNTLMSFLLKWSSRRNEFAADKYAVELGYGQHLRMALIEMHKDNLGNMDPDPWYSFFNYSHPRLVERLGALEAVQQEMNKKSE